MSQPETPTAEPTFYDLRATSLGGEAVPMSDYRGKVVLIVNTASKCGFTPQFEGLEALWQQYREQGLVVLGFPCNQFASQDPGSNDEIGEFCRLNYGVTFPMMAKIDVNGGDTDPVFQFLKPRARGIGGLSRIQWNFTKFLVGRDGTVLRRYAPNTAPASLAEDIERALAAVTE